MDLSKYIQDFQTQLSESNTLLSDLQQKITAEQHRALKLLGAVEAITIIQDDLKNSMDNQDFTLSTNNTEK